MEDSNDKIGKLDWMESFIKLSFEGDEVAAYELKFKNIPDKLYKFQMYKDDYIENILKRKMWFTKPGNFNDPYDSRGVTWDSDEMVDFCERMSKLKVIEKNDGADDIAEKIINLIRKNIRISCFSKNLYSMPMWAHYADNHRGICIEYDFTKEGKKSEIVEHLYPVMYEAERYDISELLKRVLVSVCSGSYDSSCMLFSILLNVKHESWKYEEEWRVIDVNKAGKEVSEKSEFIDGLIDCDLKPTAIYLGINFDKNKIESVKSQFEEVGIPVYCLETNNSKFFTLKEERI